MFSTIFAGRNRALAAASQTSVCQEIRNQLFPSTSPLLLQIRTATKRGGGSTKNGRGSVGKRLGVKRFTGQYVIPGNIIARQRGRQFWPGQAVGIGRDHTLVALQPGYLYFYEHEIPYPHQRPSKLHPQKALDVSKAGSIDDGSKLTRKVDEPKEFPLVKFPRGMKRFVGICRTRDEVLPRDEREEGRERWFWKTDTVEDSTNGTRPF